MKTSFIKIIYIFSVVLALLSFPAHADITGNVFISEVMSKNNASFMDADGNFSDWIELENSSVADISLTGWSLVKNGEKSWEFPEFTLFSGSRAIVFASKKDRADTELHTSFAISEGDTISLINAEGETVDSFYIEKDLADCSLVRADDGKTVLCAYPTPLFENTSNGYEFFMQFRESSSPLRINEVSVKTLSYTDICSIGTSDWVELINTSDAPLSLSGYFLSDDSSAPCKYALSGTLAAHETAIVVCDKDAVLPVSAAPFSLNSDKETLFLSDASGIVDYVSLKSIPAGYSFGRMPGNYGFFYLPSPTPGHDNSSGLRRISEQPAVSVPAGIYDGTDSLTIEIKGSGNIYYTLDCSAPTDQSEKYTGPIVLSSTAVLRAICVEDGAVPSEVLTAGYIINEGHTLPVVSVVADNPAFFSQIYMNGFKTDEVPGNISFYDHDGSSFSIPCGIKMHGATSLVLNKKNISVRFRSEYGASSLKYDLFGNGKEEFTSLIVRAGQDQNNTIIRNEVCYSLAEEFSSAVVTPRFRYVIMYLNGRYNGIYALMEKPNEQMFASREGISKSDVEMLEPVLYMNDTFYQEVLDYVFTHDMREAEYYRHIEEILDIDSIIDWSVLEGYFGNYDLAAGNVRFIRDAGSNGKWKFVFFDLDCAFYSPEYCMLNVITHGNQSAVLNTQLIKNPAYREKFLSRTSEAFHGVLSTENVLSRIDALADIVAPEVPRDSSISYMSDEEWRSHIELLKKTLTLNWVKTNIDALHTACQTTIEEETLYFGDLLQ